MNACTEFRARLASVLSGRIADEGVGALAWHGHLLDCGDCRALLEAEEALEALLASLPEPSLPPELARRVLSRLEPERADHELDALLDRPSEPEVPADLARSVLARLALAREIESKERVLDALLARLPEEHAPAGLARRVLARLENERDRARRRTAQPAAPQAVRAVQRRDSDAVRSAFASPSRRGAAEPVKGTGLRTARRVPSVRRVMLAASVALAIGAAAWLWIALGPSASDDGRGSVAGNGPASPTEPSARSKDAPGSAPFDSGEPPEDLLASLDLLESWELVTDDSVEVELTTTEGFDELLMGLEAQDAAGEAPTPTDGAPPKKG